MQYPSPLSEALVERLWEAAFLISGARKAVGRTDTTYIAGCCSASSGFARTPFTVEQAVG